MRECLHADVYLTSVNGMSEDGTLVNIDRFGNRLAATLYGPGKVYFVVGRNKLCPTYAGGPGAGPERGLAPERPADRVQDALRGRGPMLCLQEPGAHLPGTDGALGPHAGPGGRSGAHR